MFKNIAVATDGSPLAGDAVQTAIDMATKYGSKLTVLHVLMHGEPPDSLVRMAEVEHLVSDQPKAQMSPGDLPNPVLAFQTSSDKNRVSQEVIAAVGEKIVKQAKIKAEEAGVSNVEGEVLDGDSAHQIVAASKKHGADLIVLGSRGLSPLKRVLVGSVSRNVMQEAECACLVVK